MLKNIFLLVFFLLLFNNFSLFGQKYLMLDRYSTERIRVNIGDHITFKIKNDSFKKTDVIINLQDSLVTLAKYGDIALSEFEVFYLVRSKGRFKGASKVLKTVGIFFGAFALSELLRNEKERNNAYMTRQIAYSASAFAASQVLRLFHVRRYYITSQTRIRIMNMDN